MIIIGFKWNYLSRCQWFVHMVCETLRRIALTFWTLIEHNAITNTRGIIVGIGWSQRLR